MMQRISVIIPTYNYGHYLRNCIDSVLNQEGVDDVETIVVDDGSTDDTLKILESYGKKIRWFRQKKQGAPVARNKGLYESTGSYIAFLDSDDWLPPDSLYLRLQYLVENPQYDWMYGDWIYVDRSGRFIQKASEKILPVIEKRSGNIFPTLLLATNFIAVTTPLIRRDILIRSGGFRAGLPGYQDYELWLRISRNRMIGYLNKVVSYQRIHKSHISSVPENRYYAQLKIIREYYCNSETKPLIASRYRNRISNIYNYLAMIAASKSDIRGSFKNCLLSIFYKPNQYFAYKLIGDIILRNKIQGYGVDNYIMSLYEENTKIDEH